MALRSRWTGTGLPRQRRSAATVDSEGNSGVDSIPAIFAVAADPFVVLTSNAFAIAGLHARHCPLAVVAVIIGAAVWLSLRRTGGGAAPADQQVR